MENNTPKKWGIHITPNCFDTYGRPDKYAKCPECGFTWGHVYDVKNYFKHCPGCGVELQGVIEK